MSNPGPERRIVGALVLVEFAANTITAKPQRAMDVGLPGERDSNHVIGVFVDHDGEEHPHCAQG